MKLGSDTDAWELDDAEKRHQNAPDLYSVPDINERISLRPGDRAELLFLFRGRDQHGAFIQSERLTPAPWMRHQSVQNCCALTI